MTIAHQIYTLVQSLPQDKARLVLTFVESIRGELGSTIVNRNVGEFSRVEGLAIVDWY